MNQDSMVFFQKNNLFQKIKDGAHIINFNEYEHVGTHWIVLF